MIKNAKKIDVSNTIWGINFISSSKLELLKELTAHLKSGSELEMVATPNPEQVIQAHQSGAHSDLLRQYFQESRWVIPDGIGIIWATQVLASRLRQPALPERIPGVEVVTGLLEAAQIHQWSILVVGGTGYEDQPLFSQPGFFWTPGYQNVRHPTPQEEAALVETLQKQRPRIVFVAFGAPEQEAWVLKHRSILVASGVLLVMVVGGSFDFILGKVARASELWQRLGAEWLYRLIQQPWRWRRQTRLLAFIVLVAKTWLQPQKSSSF